MYPNLWDTMKSMLGGKSIALSVHIKWKNLQLVTKQTPVSSRTKRGRVTQEESMTTNNQIEDWNQENRIKVNNTKNQWNKELHSEKSNYDHMSISVKTTSN